jgi:DNA-binding winged helix-turn-helix (wHTH) protein
MGADIRLGDWIVRPQRRIIERGDEPVRVKPKSMSVLECLVAANGEPVSRAELFDTVWPGGEVSEDLVVVNRPPRVIPSTRSPLPVRAHR